jgi:DNA-binding transcriptional regulator LsrR (DeoR family)
MPRLNIYLPSDVYELADKWRGSANLSEICARAIRDELDAAEGQRAALTLLSAFRPASPLEAALAERFSLAEALVVETPAGHAELREALGQAAAAYLDRNIADGAHLAIAGGRQSWCVVRNLAPRRVRAEITALGLHQADPQLLHVHPNTLTTLLWLLYSPRSTAHLVGADTVSPWSETLPPRETVRYFVVASCAPFDRRSRLAALLGQPAIDALGARGVVGDFAYLFFDRDGEIVPVPAAVPQSIIPAPALRDLARREDARILLVAGGDEKRDAMRRTLALGVCNMLVTDRDTAEHLLEAGE